MLQSSSISQDQPNKPPNQSMKIIIPMSTATARITRIVNRKGIQSHEVMARKTIHARVITSLIINPPWNKPFGVLSPESRAIVADMVAPFNDGVFMIGGVLMFAVLRISEQDYLF